MKWSDSLTIILIFIAHAIIMLKISTRYAEPSDLGIFMQMVGFSMLLKEWRNFGYSETDPKYNDSWYNRHIRKISILLIIFGLLLSTANKFPILYLFNF